MSINMMRVEFKDRQTIILTVVMLALFGYFAVNIGKQLQLQDMQNTYKLCVAAYRETNGASEAACGAAQDRTSTEFVCNQSNNCWLEVK